MWLYIPYQANDSEGVRVCYHALWRYMMQKVSFEKYLYQKDIDCLLVSIIRASLITLWKLCCFLPKQETKTPLPSKNIIVEKYEADAMVDNKHCQKNRYLLHQKLSKDANLRLNQWLFTEQFTCLKASLTYCKSKQIRPLRRLYILSLKNMKQF